MRRPFDPLSHLPSEEAVRKRLEETELQAHRLRLLLAAVRAANAPFPKSAKQVGDLACAS